MPLSLNQTVALPGYAPYPRYGRIAESLPEGRVRVTHVQCGDPRCASEHSHGDQVWQLDELGAAAAYQPRACWERGRLSSPNTPVC